MEQATKILFLGPAGEEYDHLKALLQERSSRKFDLFHTPDLMGGFERLAHEKVDLLLLSVSTAAEDCVKRI